jgi:deoxyhypusine synthase
MGGHESNQRESRYLSGRRILPPPIRAGVSAVDLIEGAFLAYNGRRLREACRLFARRMLDPEVTVGVTLAGALTPAGLGLAALAPLIEAGFIDWIVSTGANVYHDTHFGLAMPLREGTSDIDDTTLREESVIRIYDIFFHYDVLLSTDAFYRELIAAPEFDRPMSTAEFHNLVGKYLAERERILGGEARSLLATAYRCGVPIYTSSPGDSSIGMNVAALALDGSKLRFDASADVNETAALVLDAKRSGGKSGVFILGGGSPKNFILQTEPHIQEVLGIDERGHDYFLQVTDARPDTGGLSGATPSEAVSWGKIDPDQLDDSVVCYVDSTVALPLIAAYALGTREPRPLKRLYDRREEMLATLQCEYAAARAARDERADAADRHEGRAAVPEATTAGR